MTRAREPQPTVPAAAADRARRRAVDCAVIGGGPAGLSAAVYLGRLRRSVAVFDDRDGRSLWSQVTRNYLGLPEIEAAELRRVGRAQAARYGARFVEARVTAALREGDAFRLCVEPRRAEPGDRGVAGGPGADCAGTDDNVAREDREGRELGEERPEGPEEWLARTVIVATGVRDSFPEFAGRDACVGRSLFWCILCDGYESIGRSVVVVGYDEEAASTALGLLEFTDRVALVAGRETFGIPASRLDDLRRGGIPTYACHVRDYPNRDGTIEAVALDDGARTVLPADRVFFEGPRHPRSELAAALGVRLDPDGYVETDTEQKTNARGVFAAGDVTRLHGHQISSAVHEGGMAASAANYELYRPFQKSPRDQA